MRRSREDARTPDRTLSAPLLPWPQTKLVWSLRTLALTFGLLQTWKSRHVIFSDGISYLDIAAAYVRGDWANAVNAYWSPLYSWILATVFVICRPAPEFSVPLLHLVNFVSFVVSLAAFEYFIIRLASHAHLAQVPASWLSLGYCLVIWSGLTRITIDYVSPDILVTAFIFLLSGVLLRVRGPCPKLVVFVLLGVLLGIAYLAKSIFSALALLYIPASLVTMSARSARRSLATIGAVVITSAPFVAALSLQKGRFTLGETGRLNYGWEVLGAARSTHWQGEPFNIGTPKHPTSQVFSSPATYLFSEPVAGTYPPWYDPSYWYEGIAPRFDLFRQSAVFRLNLNYVLLQTFITPGMAIALILTLGNMVPRWLAIDAVLRYWFLLIPNAAAILVYCLVFVDRRYISGFLAVLAMTLWAAIYEQLGHRRGPTAAVVGSGVLTVLLLLCEPSVLGFNTLRLDSPLHKPTRNPQWEIAQQAERAGMRPGERVGYIGLAISADWLRLKQYRVVGEITVIYDRDIWPARRVILNQREIEKFWKSDDATQEQILEEFRRAGATWVAADYVPPWADTCGWTLLGGKGVDTTYIRPLTVHVLASPGNREGECEQP